MTSVADDLRRQTISRVLAMPVAGRINLSLSLGDDDLAVFMLASGLERSVALRRLRAGRQRGRTPCTCAADKDE